LSDPDQEDDVEDVDESNQADVPDVSELDDEDLEEISEEVAEQDQADDDGEDETADQELQQPTTEDITEDDISVGHVYCRSLGVGAAVLVTRYDEEEDDPDELVDEYAQLAKQTDLDDYMDQWFEESWGTSEMSPGQGLAVGTCLFAAMVAVQNPAVMEGLAGEVGV